MPPNNEYANRDVYFNSSHQQQYIPQLVFPINAESLERGVYQHLDTFVSEKKYYENVKFIMNFQKRKIKVEFEVRNQKRTYSYSLEVEFKDMDGEFHIEE